MVFDENQNLPSVFNDQLPTLERVSASEVVVGTLNAMHATRYACIESELFKISRALSQIIWPAFAQSYNNTDLIYY